MMENGSLCMVDLGRCICIGGSDLLHIECGKDGPTPTLKEILEDELTWNTEKLLDDEGSQELDEDEISEPESEGETVWESDESEEETFSGSGSGTLLMARRRKGIQSPSVISFAW